ncbi:MAG: hypothetical protein RR212_00690 [Bacteroidales bacterium]
MKHIFITIIFSLIVLLPSFSQQVFKPVSATLEQGGESFTSTQFDCANMMVYDNKSSVTVSVAGDRMTLSQDRLNKDTYSFQASKGQTQIRVVALRSSSSGKIYIVTSTTITPREKATITFKP